mgnify:CR=1 FL=1
MGTAPLADEEAFPLNTPVLIAGSLREAAKLKAKEDTENKGEGTLPGALDSIFDQAGAVVVVIRVAKGDTDTETTANVIGGVNATTGNYEGLKALLGAESKLGVVPRILVAPGFTHQRDNAANAVVAELKGIAQRMRAVVIADGPNKNDEAAIQYAGDFGDARVYVVDPWVLKLDDKGKTVAAPASPCVAGLLARIDNDEGFWVSPSNHEISGIVGTARPVDFTLGDSNARANLLNEKKIATIVRQDGYRLWQPHAFIRSQVGVPVRAPHGRHDQRVAAARAPLGCGQGHHENLPGGRDRGRQCVSAQPDGQGRHHRRKLLGRSGAEHRRPDRPGQGLLRL